MENPNGYQKIKCNVADCLHNQIKTCTCRLNEIRVCPCSSHSTSDALKDTACSSYEYANLQHMEKYD